MGNHETAQAKAVHNYKNMNAPVLESITPAKAEAYLNRNTSNRKLRDGVVEKYAADMLDGKWTECIVPIAFYDNGDVADGQHRLWAIVQSGVTQRFFVLKNVPREAGLNIDAGLPRSLVDNARISGVDPDLSNILLAVSRAMEMGARTSKAMSNSQKLALVKKHEEAAKWVVAHGPTGRNMRNQCVLAAIGRAYYHEENKERLQRFCRVLSDGLPAGPDEFAAASLRTYLMERRNAHLNQLFNETFLKVQNCIKKFMEGKPVTIVRAPSEEIYPLPKAMRTHRIVATLSGKKRKNRDA